MMHANKFITLHDHEYDEDSGKFKRDLTMYALVEPEKIADLIRVFIDQPDSIMDQIKGTEAAEEAHEVLDYFDQFVEWED